LLLLGVLLVAKIGSLDSVGDFAVNLNVPIIFINFDKINVKSNPQIPNGLHRSVNGGIDTAFLIVYVNYCDTTNSLLEVSERVRFRHRNVYHGCLWLNEKRRLLFASHKGFDVELRYKVL
jgi:aminopeptidase-like protein